MYNKFRSFSKLRRSQNIILNHSQTIIITLKYTHENQYCATHRDCVLQKRVRRGVFKYVAEDSFQDMIAWSAISSFSPSFLYWFILYKMREFHIVWKLFFLLWIEIIRRGKAINTAVGKKVSSPVELREIVKIFNR